MKFNLGFVCLGLVCATGTAGAQSVLFNFENGPQFTGTPVDQFSGGVRAHFFGMPEDPLHPAYSIQNIAQVIGMYPTGFSGLGLSPSTVFGADLFISFFSQADGTVLGLTDFNIMVAPQELACDSSSTMKITAYSGTTVVGTNTAVAPSDLNMYTWPTINLGFTSAQPFDNVDIHFQSGPPTGGDWGGIFVADNVTASPAPEPGTMMGMGIGLLSVSQLLWRRKRARK